VTPWIKNDRCIFAFAWSEEKGVGLSRLNKLPPDIRAMLNYAPEQEQEEHFV